MRRTLVLAALPLLMLAACAEKKPETPVKMEGRWSSVTVSGEDKLRTVTFRLDPDGKFFGTDFRPNTSVDYIIEGTWERTNPNTVILTTKDKKETFTVQAIKDSENLSVTAKDFTAILKRVPD